MEATQTKDQAIRRQSVTSSETSYFSLINRSFAYPALDGLRAIAIILVLLRHAVYEFQAPAGGLAVWLWNLCRNGWLGVDLFFVLSGFLITRSFFSLTHKCNGYPSAIKQFYINRSLRTWPLYFAVIALIAIGIFPYYQVSSSTIAAELLQHVLFLQDYFGTSILVPMWSLATEEKFYLLIPLLFVICAALKKHHMLVLLIGIVIASTSMRLLAAGNPAVDDYESFFWFARAPFHLALDGLLAGCVVYFVYQIADTKPARLIYKLSALLISLIALGLLTYQDYLGNAEWLTSAAIISAASIGFAALVYLALFSNKNWLCGKPLRIISTLSYSLYLCHYALLPWCYRISGISDSSSVAFLSPKWLLFFACFISISFIVSLILHYSIEKPFLLWKQKLQQ